MSKNLEKATFAAGCFWGVEESFRILNGVKATQVGYTDGQKENPNYEEVCSGRTHHAEAVEVTFDPSIIPYQYLLNVFWEAHDPTTLNRQGPDHGTQYRSGIYFHNEKQKELAEKSKADLEKSGTLSRPIVTEIKAASTFWPAEEYHQKYLAKKGISSCPI